MKWYKSREKRAVVRFDVLDGFGYYLWMIRLFLVRICYYDCYDNFRLFLSGSAHSEDILTNNGNRNSEII